MRILFLGSFVFFGRALRLERTALYQGYFVHVTPSVWIATVIPAGHIPDTIYSPLYAGISDTLPRVCGVYPFVDM